MKDRLYDDLRSAMRCKDTSRLTTIRLIKKYIQELETSVGHSGEATDVEILKIILRRIVQLKWKLMLILLRKVRLYEY